MPSPASCTLSGPGVPSGYMNTVPAASFNGDYTTGALTSYSTFTLTCQNGAVTNKATFSVEVVPTVSEN